MKEILGSNIMQSLNNLSTLYLLKFVRDHTLKG